MRSNAVDIMFHCGLMQFTRPSGGLTVNSDHEQRITMHLNLSSDQCKYHHRMRVRGDFRTLAMV
jgi:hypothetical protein